jgi:uncharacterized Zn finger protein
MSWRDFRRFKPSVPQAVSGGIKAQSRQGNFGKNWWAKRWISVLESFHLGARLSRGRSYARRGQVVDIQVETGVVTAHVQGSRPQPYSVEIGVKTLSNTAQAKLGSALSQQALFAAKLLAGEMPQVIEQALSGTGVSLFPDRLDDLKTQCSCPDWSNPCKHIAAVYYLMGEEFDRDPFLIFKLRGIDRDKLTALLGERGQSADKRKRGNSPALRRATTQALEPIKPAAEAFWDGAALPPGWLGELRTPPLPGALLKRLGNFPFWRGNERILDALIPIYCRASESALELILGGHNEENNESS